MVLQLRNFKKEINDLLLKMQSGENSIIETENKLIDLQSDFSLKSKEKGSSPFIGDLLIKMQTGENCIGETANKLLDLFIISCGPATPTPFSGNEFQFAKFNCNNCVWVYLTDKGIEHVVQAMNEGMSFRHLVSFNEFKARKNELGYHVFQMHIFMNYFGGLGMNASEYFDVNIIFQYEDLDPTYFKE